MRMKRKRLSTPSAPTDPRRSTSTSPSPTILLVEEVVEEEDAVVEVVDPDLIVSVENAEAIVASVETAVENVGNVETAVVSAASAVETVESAEMVLVVVDPVEAAVEEVAAVQEEERRNLSFNKRPSLLWDNLQAKREHFIQSVLNNKHLMILFRNHSSRRT